MLAINGIFYARQKCLFRRRPENDPNNERSMHFIDVRFDQSGLFIDMFGTIFLVRIFSRITKFLVGFDCILRSLHESRLERNW